METMASLLRHIRALEENKMLNSDRLVFVKASSLAVFMSNFI